MENRKLLMPFFMLGQYNDDVTMNILEKAVLAGADYIELGIPHTDPLADGQVLRDVADKAIKNGMTPEKAIRLAGQAADRFGRPVYVLTYLNTLFGYGVERFAKDASEAGIKGFIVPDLPLEAQKDIKNEYDFRDLTVAAFTSPTSGDRLKEIANESDGLIYSVNYTGITGRDGTCGVDSRVKDNYEVLKQMTDRPILSGFGIDGPEAAESAVKYADGVIIGTKLCQISEGQKTDDIPDIVYDFLKSVRSAID